MDALTQAMLLNLWIGTAYVLASMPVGLFAWRYRAPAARFVAARLHDWPRPRLAASAAVAGCGALASTFLLGCGLHHAHLFAHALYAGAVPSQTTAPALVFNYMQAVGAPGFVVLAWFLYAAASRRLVP